jgi:hypothetical protein
MPLGNNFYQPPAIRFSYNRNFRDGSFSARGYIYP